MSVRVAPPFPVDPRPIDPYFLAMAMVVATRSTCRRRSVGCVLVDDQRRVLSTGYNGVPSGYTHCTDSPCLGAMAASGHDLDLCEAIHAEQNAVAFCPAIDRIRTAYTTTKPCISCQKLLLNTGCQRIVFFHDYAQPVSLLSDRIALVPVNQVGIFEVLHWTVGLLSSHRMTTPPDGDNQEDP